VSDDADQIARVQDQADALGNRLRDADAVHESLESRINVLQRELRALDERGERMERVTDQIWNQSRGNADAIRQMSSSTHAILQAVLDSRKASEQRHEQQQRDIVDLSGRIDGFERRLSRLEKLFPARAWLWMLAAAAIGVGTIFWKVYEQWLLDWLA